MTASDPYNLHRFVEAQDGIFDTALGEIRAGSKESHWMWFVFPQLAESGRSPTAKFYGLQSIEQARAYLGHAMLGPRLLECVDALLAWAGKRSAGEIFGAIDSMKLRSSLTLFDEVEPAIAFDRALLNFFEGRRDELTLALLQRGR